MFHVARSLSFAPLSARRLDKSPRGTGPDAVRNRDNQGNEAAHESPRTTKLCHRTGDEITLDEVERIGI